MKAGLLDVERMAVGRGAEAGRRPIRVLVVEDEALYAEVVCSRMEQDRELCMRPFLSPSLSDACRRLEHETFDAVLLDLMLPDSRGLDTLRRMRTAAPELPLVVLTGLGHEATALQALKDGAQDYLLKGVDEARVVKTIRFAVERHRTHEALHAARMLLIQAERMESIGRLAAGVAHEVKNPLAIIQAGLDSLRRRIDDADETGLEILDDIESAVARALDTVRGLLDYSAATELCLQQEALPDLIEGLMPLLRHELDRRHIELERVIDPELPLLMLDRRKIQQAFLNLAINAIDAMPDGGQLTIRLERFVPVEPADADPAAGPVGVRAAFEDTGPGLSKQTLNRLFEPFFTTKAQGRGTGLGLAITRNIIELHGGHLSLENRPEGGARATVTFIA